MLALEQPGHQLARALALHLGIRPEDDPVREHRLGQGFDVVRDHVRAALYRGEGLAGVEEIERAPCARAKRDFRVAARPPDEAGGGIAALGVYGNGLPPG